MSVQTPPPNGGGPPPVDTHHTDGAPLGAAPAAMHAGAGADDRSVRPFGGTGGVVRKSWASALGGSLPNRNYNNVLEVVLEKEARGSFTVTEKECAHMMGKLGLDARPGVHVEAAQICPQGRGVIFITLRKELDPTRFCRHEVFEVTESGIRAVHVKPAGKREVVVTTKGIHPNTEIIKWRSGLELILDLII